MITFYVVIREIIIQCTTRVGCIQISQSDFGVLIFAGLLELAFDIAGIVKIYFKKDR